MTKTIYSNCKSPRKRNITPWELVFRATSSFHTLALFSSSDEWFPTFFFGQCSPTKWSQVPLNFTLFRDETAFVVFCISPQRKRWLQWICGCTYKNKWSWRFFLFFKQGRSSFIHTMRFCPFKMKQHLLTTPLQAVVTNLIKQDFFPCLIWTFAKGQKRLIYPEIKRLEENLNE